MNSLVWLASYPKSGNTWMRLLFAAYQMASEDSSFQLHDAFRVTMSESRRTDFERLAGKGNLTVTEVDQLREAVQVELSERVRPPVLLKTHNARVQHQGYPIIRRELTLGAIYVVRNPLDIVDSFADHWGVSKDRAIEMMNNRRQSIGGPNADLVTQYLESWSEHVKSWVDQRVFPVHIVRYEDLLNSRETTLRNVLTFLGWEADPDRIAKALSETEFERLKERESADGFEETSKKSSSGRFFRRGVAGHWRESLSAQQIDRICLHHGEVMRRFGYLSTAG